MIAADSRFAAGVGASEESDSFSAGANATRQALNRAGLDRCDLVLIFSTSKHDPQKIRDGVRSIAGPDARITGGYAVGIITNDFLSYGGYEVGVAVFRSQTYEFTMHTAGDLPCNEEAVGRALGATLTASNVLPEDPLLLFYDSVDRTSGKMRLNMATPLLAGIAQTAPQLTNLAGAGFCGDMRSLPTHQWFDDQVLEHKAIALSFSGGLQMHSRIIHGCAPSSSYRTITAADGPAVLEIDGKPALDAIAEMIGSDIPVEEYGFFVTLGVNHGDKWGDYEESQYTNRLCLKVDRERGALIMFEPDLVEGTEIQLMRRSIDLTYIGAAVEGMLSEIAASGRTPRFALYIDCAGRAAAYSGSDEEEALEVQRSLEQIPLLGFYSGVEIAPVNGVPRPLDWTGVLCIFSD